MAILDIVNSLLKCNSSVNLCDINILLYILLVQTVVQMLYRFYLTIIVTFIVTKANLINMLFI